MEERYRFHRESSVEKRPIRNILLAMVKWLKIDKFNTSLPANESHMEVAGKAQLKSNLKVLESLCCDSSFLRIILFHMGNIKT